VIERVSDVVAPYGITRETVDGNDVAAVWEAFGRFLHAARAGEGPFLLECLTYRLRGHYEGDPTQYREAIAAEEWQQRDPIARLARLAAAEGWFGEPQAQAAESDARAEVEAAVEFARASPYPQTALLEQLVYAR
jgi:pyruvate dehydrogenase E1 component alpha subunit